MGEEKKREKNSHLPRKFPFTCSLFFKSFDVENGNQERGQQEG